MLRDAGYKTAAFHSNPFLTRMFHYDSGFDVFKDSLGVLNQARKQKFKMQALKPPTAHGRILAWAGSIFNRLFFSLGGQHRFTAEGLTNRGISWLNTCQGNFFLWLHYMDVHYPYLPPSGYTRRFCNRRVSRYRMTTLHQKLIKNLTTYEQLSSAEIDMLINLYDANISYVDDNIYRLLDSLGSRRDDTIIIITADHGESFGEHGSLGHGTLYDEVLHVPLVVVGGDVKAGTMVGELVELMGLAPTIADLAGINIVKGFHGKSLLQVMEGSHRGGKGIISTRVFPGYNMRGLSYHTSDWKYIRSENLDEANNLLSEELYSLKNDPQETNNLHDEGNEEANRFELEARKKIAEFKKRKFEENSGYEKQRIRAKLSKMKKP